MNKTAVIAVVVVFLAVVGFLVMRGNSAPATQTQLAQGESPTQAVVADESTGSGDAMEAGNVVEVAVGGSPFKFDPATINVKKGDTVRVIFTNVAGMHDFVIDEFNARTKVLTQADQTETIEFIADKAGSFEYYCSVGNHRAMGMKGTLVVTE